MKGTGVLHVFLLVFLVGLLIVSSVFFFQTCAHPPRAVEYEPEVLYTPPIISPPLVSTPITVEEHELPPLPPAQHLLSLPAIIHLDDPLWVAAPLPLLQHLFTLPAIEIGRTPIWKAASLPIAQHLISLPTVGIIPAWAPIPSAPIIEKLPINEEFSVSPPTVEPVVVIADEAGEVVAPIAVPPPPFMFEPMIFSDDDWDIVDFDPFVEISDEDFWADFFVVGQDAEIAFDDGFYFLNLFINGERVGDIEVEFLEDRRLVSTDELSYYVGPHITADATKRIFGDKLEYISLGQLNERGVSSRYSASDFAIYLTFDIADMPERMVSITTSSINRRQQYGMSGAIPLKPANFSLASTISLYASIDYPTDFSMINNRLLSVSVSNRISFYGVALNFYFTLTPRLPGSSSTAKVFNFGSWNGFYDFVESSHRLSFGNVGSNLSGTNPGGQTTNIGVTFDKNYAYGTSTAKGNQLEHRIVIVEPSKVQILINGEEVFSRQFQPGTYRLRDFVLTQGANQIMIRVITDSGEVHTEYVDMGYDYRLLGKGDTLYGLGISVPQVKSTTPNGTFSIPWIDEQYLSYHLDKFTATYYQQIGVTDTFTFSTDLAFSPGIFSGTFNGVWATMVGTSQAQLTLGLDESKVTPSLTASISHRVSGGQKSSFGTLSTTVSHSIPALGAAESYASTSSLSLSYSGKITERIRYTISSNFNYATATNLLGWSTSIASGFSPFRGFSISGSITASGTATVGDTPILSAQISGSYSFSPKLSANSSTSIQGSGQPVSSSLGVSWRPSSSDSVSFSLNAFKFADPTNNTMTAYWNHSGDLASFSLRQQLSNTNQTMTTTLTASTALAYSQGAIGIARSVSDSFLLVKPKGDLKRSDISVARSLDSSPSYLPRPLGSALYNAITPNAKNSIVVFSSGATAYSTGHSFVFEASPRSRQSFVAKLQVEPSFTVSGILLHADYTPYIQYSSPVYQVIYDEEGERELVRDDSLYLFTDQEGRYILSEVKSGTYLFDLEVEDLWYAVEFTIPEVDGEKIGSDRVILLEEFWVTDPAMQERIIIHDALSGLIVEEEEDVFGTALATGYDANIELNITEQIDEETFWSIIFPPFDESAFGFEAFDSDFVTQEDFFFDESFFDQLVGIPEADDSATQVITAAP